MSNLKRNGQLRWPPSYLRRQGQMTRAQKIAWRELWPTWGLEFRHGEVIDLPSNFGRPTSGPCHLEVGFGLGDHLVRQAVANPETAFLGIEVHKPGIAAALAKIRDRELTNVRVMRGDARLILTDHLAGPCFHHIDVLFPDPWPNDGDAHRRLIQPGLLEVIESRLHPGGTLHLATDVDVYAEHARVVFAHQLGWESIEQDYPPHTTKYAQKGIAEGRSITDLTYRFG